MALSPSSLTTILTALKIARPVIDAIQVWRGKPSSEDRTRLIKYARRLDERRVFSAPFNVEVVELCTGSLRDVLRFTDDTLAELEHPGARAVVASILDCVRKFLDRWGAYQTPRYWDMPRPGRDDEEFPEFFRDLGELRGKVKFLVEMLKDFEPMAVAPGLTRENEE